MFMKSIFTKVVLGVAVAGFSAAVFASDALSPVGLWKTIDEKTNTAKSLIRISEKDGVLSGTIEKLLDPNAKKDGVCSKCKDDDERKNKPIVGMTNLTGLKKDGDLYKGGKILNPEDGQSFIAEVEVTDGGKKLELNVFLRFVPVPVRTQVWERVE
jgi:uncharacterized protein (DUF2147 family)